MRPRQAQKLMARSADEWVAALRGLSGHGLRVRVACLVWWDYFADRMRSDAFERWVGMAYDAEAVETPDELVMQGLREVGYSEAMVAKKFKKSTQALNQGRRQGKRGPSPCQRRDCHVKRAKGWNRAERSVRIA